MKVIFGFRHIEAHGYRSIHFQALAGLDGETFFVQIQQFAKVYDHAWFWTIETGIYRSVNFMTKVATTLSDGRSCDWIRQTANTAVHTCYILTQDRMQRASVCYFSRRIPQRANFLCPTAPNAVRLCDNFAKMEIVDFASTRPLTPFPRVPGSELSDFLRGVKHGKFVMTTIAKDRKEFFRFDSETATSPRQTRANETSKFHPDVTKNMPRCGSRDKGEIRAGRPRPSVAGRAPRLPFQIQIHPHRRS